MRGKAWQQFWRLLQALFFDDGVTGCLKLLLPGRQHSLIKRAGGCFSHDAIPNFGDNPGRLWLGKAFEGLPINSEYSQEIADPLVLSSTIKS
jgi:hypothetical protein